MTEIHSVANDVANLESAERTVRAVTEYWRSQGYLDFHAWPVMRGKNRDGRHIWGVESNAVNGVPPGKRRPVNDNREIREVPFG